MAPRYSERAPYQLMPHTVGKGPSLDIASFPNNFIIRISFRSDPDALEAVLPPGLSLAGEPMITFMYRHSENLSWVGGGELNAVGATVLAQYSTPDGPATGAYWPFLWEDDAMAVILGREVFGAAKLYGDISKPQCVDGTWLERLSERGRPLIEIQFQEDRPASAEELRILNEQGQQARVIGWKHIPTADMRGSELSHPTLFHSPAHFSDAHFGSGEVTVYEGDRNENVWSRHVLAALREIPLLECTSAVLTRGSSEHRISGGKRLA